jgi:hypothetical protein
MASSSAQLRYAGKESNDVRRFGGTLAPDKPAGTANVSPPKGVIF